MSCIRTGWMPEGQEPPSRRCCTPFYLPNTSITPLPQPRASCGKTVGLVTRAEEYLARKARKPLPSRGATSPSTARDRYRKIAPILRGLLAVPTDDADRPRRRVVLGPVVGVGGVRLCD